jgi:excisionase family DNA binding protein
MSDELAALRRDLLVLSTGTQKEPTEIFGKPTLLTAEVAAAYLMVSRTLIFALTKSRELDSVLIGSARRVPRVACDAYVASLMDARRNV